MTHGRELVSVIIPTWNRASLLREAIDSVLAQTYAPLELIVVDDGSTDDTPSLLRSYGDRIRVVTQQNRGGTAARNAGTRLARGAYLNWLDHDDLMHPRKIERQMELFRARPCLGLVHCGYDKIDAHGRLLERMVGLPEGNVTRRLVCGCFLWSGAPLVRRECIARVGTFDESVWSSDADLWLRIALAGWTFGCVQEPLGSYRILPDGSMADVARTENADFAILDRAFARPGLAPEVAAMRTEAYFNQRFWLATRYYTIGRWDDARRNFSLALELKPAVLADDAADLLPYLSGAAMDPRVGDPARFLADVLAHLPPAAAALQGRARRLEAQVQLRLALRAYAFDHPGEARAALYAALAADAHVLEQGEHLAAAAHEAARHHACDPLRLLESVLGDLPGSSRARAARRRVLRGALFWRSASEHRARGRWPRAGRDVLAALRERPSYAPWLARRAFLRSGSVVKQSLRRGGSVVRRSLLRARRRTAPVGDRSR